SYKPPNITELPSTLAALVDEGRLGFKSGKGFYDYPDDAKQAIMAKRDKQLFEVFRLAQKFLDDPV
ncbi:MAG: 3-hydroxyacyl-CoA dehydrogenase family protein, partial [Clostridiales Family XIII bacterium]|nr:3-hydroxyacyl-CoA dehydrogenase family protein [Clostridiales Family XIII bacterium]